MKELVSIVIPCYRSEQTIKKVVDEIVDEFKGRDYDYEIVLVNDGSPDNTFDVIKAICETDDHVTGINLSRNFGQSNAIMAGMQYVHGDFMIAMDDDGQHPAEGIFKLVEKLKEGYDVVYAWFQHKQHSVFKRFTSYLNYKSQVALGNNQSGVHLSSFVGYSSFSIKLIKNSSSPVSGITRYVTRLSNRVTSIPMEHRGRMEGDSNYTLMRLLKQWRKSVTSFSTKILDLSIYMGGFCALISFIYAVVIFIRKLLHPAMAIGYASTLIIMLLLAGIIMLLMGILGDYIGRMFLILVKLPNYSVRDEYLNIYSKREDNK